MQPSLPDARSEPSSSEGASSRPLAVLFTVAGPIGLIAAFTLLIEKIALIKDPNYVPSCSFNPILSCGSIMRTGQAEVFGFPNPIIGVAGFAAISTVGVAMLAGAVFKRWFWWGVQAGTFAGVVFVHWLIFQSLYRIDALCPYCMIVWVVTIPLFWYTTLNNLRSTIGLETSRGVRILSEYHGVAITVWYLIIATLIAFRFWDYWKTLLT